MSKYILVADDREGIRDLLTFLLDSLRYQVRTAVNGLEVLALLREELPQLAVVDLKMPEINGIQLMEKIREYAPDLPVVLITGYHQDQQIQEALDRGLVQEVVSKPFDIHVLTKKIEGLIQ